MSQFHEFQWRALRTSVAAVEAHRHLPMVVAQRGVKAASPICSSTKRNWISSPMTLCAGINGQMAHSHTACCGLHKWRCVRLLPQQSLIFAALSCHRSYGSEGEVHVQRKQRQGSNRSDPKEGGKYARPDAPPAVQRVLEAAQHHRTAPCGSSFWASQREEVMHHVKDGKVSLATAALLVVAFSKAGELTVPVAIAVSRRLCSAFRAAARGGASPLLLDDAGPSREGVLITGTEKADLRVHFSDAATVLLAMKEGGLLHDPAAGFAARELQDELLTCLQPQWNSLTFSELRRLFLLLGATAEPLGLHMAAARELLIAAKRHLRKMQKTKRRLFEESDARDTVALVWPLASVSAAMDIPAPQISSNSRAVLCSALDCNGSSNEDVKQLQRDRDIVLLLLKEQAYRAVSSRLPCSPFDLALGFAGLERLGQQSCAEYVLAAFSKAAAAANCEELCSLGRDMVLAGTRQKALWVAFADAVQTAAEHRLQTLPSHQHSSTSHHIEAELIQWLRFCGRTI